MWIVRIALTRPYTFIVAALVIVLMSPIVLQRTPTDVFPNIDIPVVSICWNYAGLSPQLMEDRIVSPYERFLTTVVDNVEHVESFAKQGIGGVQIWFNWGADINVGQMEVMQRITQILNSLPPGILQPFIVKFDVSNIPVSLVTVSSDDLDERALYDLASNTIAPQIEQIANVAANHGKVDLACR